MTEDIEPYIQTGHSLDVIQLRLEAYRLALLFLSAGPAAQIVLSALEQGKFRHGHWLERLSESFFHGEASRILVYTAIQGRLYANVPHVRSCPVWEMVCGKLEVSDKKNMSVELGKGQINAERMPLSLREAFNKIIHSEIINTDSEEVDESGLFHPSRINPILYLYGHQMNGKPWRVELDVLEYVRLIDLALPK